MITLILATIFPDAGWKVSSTWPLSLLELVIEVVFVAAAVFSPEPAPWL